MRNLIETGEIYGSRITVKQVQKRTAKKLFERGVNVYFQSSNYRPLGIWQSLCLVTNKGYNEEEKFETICNEYEYYNCCSERGNYINFYVNIKDV